MSEHKMISFYAQSSVAGKKILPTTAPQVIEKLERIFRVMEELYSVKMEDKKISGLDGEVLQRWFIEASQGWKPATINSYVCTLKPFLRWAHQMSSGGVRYIDEDLTGILSTVRIPAPDELPEDERPKDKYYTHEQADELLFGDHGYNQVRDRAIAALVLCSGLRTSELCSLTIGQFRSAVDGKIRLRRKGGAWATAVIGQDAFPLIEAYLKTRKDADDPERPLFVTTHGNACTRQQLYKAISKKQKAMGVATGLHALRHTAISEVMNTAGAAVARDFANHRTLNVTNRYSHTTEDQRLDAANGLRWGRTKKGA